ncbi:MAG: hypothetical protein K9K65_06965 [Desulfarculaceae bacterium]|nr:hypothetical protein [Desulfarculaceae bacterium]MCF8049178.1 hypothetical protein [Desulfarculaceae bacterium]MCF8064584.1 hypothetical protein [Desulfarculaceae bacterium]MCF8097567.1 hypothetical protein [Desulfarculaceae bacterium]MCF8123371.1 hypothetical protein [Desulfarculaceae bacterium]
MKGRSVALIAAAVLISALALSLGCSTTDQGKAARQEIAWVPKKLAVMPFIRVDSPIQPGGTVCCPLTGATFNTGQIIPGAERVLDNALGSDLAQMTTIPFVPYAQTGLVFGQIAGRQYKDNLRKDVVATGKKLGADAVLVGFIFRFRQRQGTGYAVDKPASVAFDLSIVRVSDGSVLWKNSFDETQQSLSQDLLNLGQYMKHGLSWYTAEELGKIGMTRLLQRFPWRKTDAKTE